MSKFKAGDVVVRTHSCHAGMRKGDTGTVAEDAFRGSVKLVEYPQSAHAVGNLELVPTVGLPPAPTDVNYNEGVGLRTLRVTSLEANSFHPACIRVGILGKDGQGYTVLSPDDVLQLCHDLRRMAMDIKRKEKANA